MKYKVLVEIEELTDDGDASPQELPLLPDSLGTFDTVEDAMDKAWRVVKAHGFDLNNSNFNPLHNRCVRCGRFRPRCPHGISDTTRRALDGL